MAITICPYCNYCIYTIYIYIVMQKPKTIRLSWTKTANLWLARCQRHVILQLAKPFTEESLPEPRVSKRICQDLLQVPNSPSIFHHATDILLTELSENCARNGSDFHGEMYVSKSQRDKRIKKWTSLSLLLGLVSFQETLFSYVCSSP